MKIKKTLLLSLICVISTTSFSQEKVNPRLEKSTNVTSVETEKPKEKIVQKSKTVTISKRAGEEQQVHDAAYYTKEIAKIDEHLSAIQIKTDSINSIPEEKVLAEEQGWFTSMENIKAQLIAKREALVSKSNK